MITIDIVFPGGWQILKNPPVSVKESGITAGEMSTKLLNSAIILERIINESLAEAGLKGQAVTVKRHLMKSDEECSSLATIFIHFQGSVGNRSLTSVVGVVEKSVLKCQKNSSIVIKKPED